MTDTAHLDAIYQRLANEQARLDAAKTDRERAFRSWSIGQITKEVTSELNFLGAKAEGADDMTDDELLAALSA